VYFDEYLYPPHEIRDYKTKNNDERIGKISLILIMAFIAYIIWTIIDAYAYPIDGNDMQYYD